MKYTNKFLGALCLTAFGFASCADDYSLLDYEVSQMPADLAAVEYLKEYDDVKTYVDREANPNFKLGAGVTVSSYNEGGIDYRMAAHNFDEVTAGNAMKHASVVANDGSMEFGPVENFVEKAQAAGQTIYGHTLAWHSQQNTKYLNNIISDIIDPNYVPEYVPVTKVENRTCIIVPAGEKVENPWDHQFFLTFPGASFAEGDTWSVKMNIRADKNTSGIDTQTHTGPGGYIHWAGIGTISFTTEWVEYTASGSMTAEQVGGNTFAFNLNAFAEANNYYFDDISFMLNGEELVVNGDCNDPEGTTNYVSVAYKQPQVPSTIVDSYEYTVMEEKKVIQDVARTCIMVESDDKVEQAWDTQFWIIFPGTEFKEGDSWSVSMEVRAEKDASSSTQVHKDAGAYLHWAAIGTVPFTTDWAVYSASGTIEAAMNGGYSIAFNLNDFAEANKYYFDNISFKLNGAELVSNGNLDGDDMTNFIAKEKRGGMVPARKIESYTIELPGGRTPLTPEEKKDTLMWAMDNWIKGMMTATKGYVSTWDAINEPISGVGGEFYDLWSADNGDAKNFYWQDYLGDEEYVRFVIAKAREYYTGEEPLKLFVNDYNLESDWDQNKKLKSLIHWIEVWESDNTTKIDGIGTQMHISYYENPETLASKNAAIENMFKLMAATGKLVKISELDLAYVGADGKVIKSKDLTEEQIKTLSDYYKYIVDTYMELIPANQQYGITLWCPIDSPASSSWRGGEAVGLWDGNYNRRHTYAGFADGLAGAE